MLGILRAFNFYSYSACKDDIEVEDCTAWQDLYDATDGKNWLRCSANRDTPCECSGAALPPATTAEEATDLVPWGVNCEGDAPTRRIAGPLYLHSNGMSGTLPDTVGSMIMVTQLWLQHNKISGTIPATIKKMGSVISLVLSDNAFGGLMPASRSKGFRYFA